MLVSYCTTKKKQEAPSSSETEEPRTPAAPYYAGEETGDAGWLQAAGCRLLENNRERELSRKFNILRRLAVAVAVLPPRVGCRLPTAAGCSQLAVPHLSPLLSSPLLVIRSHPSSLNPHDSPQSNIS